MAENDSTQEKTEEPTSKRIQKSRDDGQVARSQELSIAATVITVAGFMYLFGGAMIIKISEQFAAAFVFDPKHVFDVSGLTSRVGKGLMDALLVVAPLGAAAFVVSLLVSGVLGGYNFSWKAIAPKASKLNPLSGLKRLFGMKVVFDFFKTIGKFLLVGGLTYLLVDNYVGQLMFTSLMNFEGGLALGGSIIVFSFLVATLALVIIAMIDVPYQLQEYNKKLKMTKQEVKEEAKDTDGRPEVKQRIRQKQRELASMRMLEAIADADVVITNPEHFAVALAYDPTGDLPPKLVAKGSDFIAEKIRERAKEEGVPLFTSPTLARSLFFTTDLNGYIPEPLYEAVAQVIAFIFNINSFNRGGVNSEIPVPRVPLDMRFDKNGEPEES